MSKGTIPHWHRISRDPLGPWLSPDSLFKCLYIYIYTFYGDKKYHFGVLTVLYPTHRRESPDLVYRGVYRYI